MIEYCASLGIDRTEAMLNIHDGIKIHGLESYTNIFRSHLIWGFDTEILNDMEHDRLRTCHELEYTEDDIGIVSCKCGSKRTLTNSKQTRSGDECMTVFCTCLDCGFKWKF